MRYTSRAASLLTEMGKKRYLQLSAVFPFFPPFTVWQNLSYFQQKFLPRPGSAGNEENFLPAPYTSWGSYKTGLNAFSIGLRNVVETNFMRLARIL